MELKRRAPRRWCSAWNRVAEEVVGCSVGQGVEGIEEVGRKKSLEKCKKKKKIKQKFRGNVSER